MRLARHSHLLFLSVLIAALLACTLSGPALAQSSSALRSKATEVGSLLAKAARPTGVRVILTLRGATAGAGARPSASSSTRRASSLSTTGPLRDGQEATVEHAQILATHVADETKRRRWSPRLIRNTPYMAVTVSQAELETLAMDSTVVRIHEDGELQPGLQDSVPLIGMGPAYNLGATGANTMVVILDTGVEYGHVFTTPRVTNATCFSGQNAGFASLCPNGQISQFGGNAGQNCGLGGCSHGTHVAGIAAGNRASGIPLNGVAKSADIFAGQVFSRRLSDSALRAQDSDLLASLNDLLGRINNNEFVPRKIAAINISIWDLGFQVSGNCDNSSRAIPFKTVIDALKTAGTATVIISGNGSQPNMSAFPGCISSAVTVGATSKLDQVASYSNLSTIVDLFAPGGEPTTTATQITSSVPPNPNFAGDYGTSMAAPHVAGAFAAIRSVCTSATIDQIEAALKSTGTPVTDNRFGAIWTKPRIRVDLAVQQLGCGASVATCTVSYTPANVALGQNLSVSWSAQNATSRSYTLRTSSGALIFGPQTIALSGSVFIASMNDLAPGTYVRTDTVTGTGGSGQCSATLTITSSSTPSCTVSYNPTTVVRGQSLSVSWSAQNTTSRSYTLRTSSGALIFGPQTIAISGSVFIASMNDLGPGTYVRTDTVTGTGGSGQCSATLTVTSSSTPTCTVSYTPATVARGQSLFVSWSEQNATSRSYTLRTSFGALIFGPQTVALNGIVFIASFNDLGPGTYVRTDTVTGSGGSGQCSATLTVSG